MGILDWFRTGSDDEPEDAGMSRRDFFARVAGRGSAGEEETAAALQPAAEDPGVLHRFRVTTFPYHDGPVLVPILAVGEEYRLTPDPPYSREPTGLRIQRGRDTLGVVPPELVPDLLVRLAEGQELICRAAKVDPTAGLAEVLTVEIVRPPEVEDRGEPEEAV